MKLVTAFLLLMACLAGHTFAAERVTVDNFARAETDTYFRAQMKATGIAVGELNHIREPVTPENNQGVIRQNQDTLYSGIILDLAKPVIFTLPETGNRFQSMHVVNQDHYMFVETEPGTYELNKESVGTRFAQVIIRTFADPNDPEDVKKAHAAQDGIKIKGGGKGPFEAPNWDQETLATARTALNSLAALGFSADYAFGRKEETRPVDHLIGAAAGWGGQPRTAAMYDIESVAENDGKTPYVVTVKEVPVDAFWSITIYNAEGMLEKNDLGRNSFNNYTAKPSIDGSFTIHFGGDPKAINYLPITTGWNYVVRMYQPRKELLDGSWSFSKPEKIN